MLKAIIFSVLLPATSLNIAATTATPNTDPDLKVWLNKSRHIERGDRIRTYVRAHEDGYLVVLHQDPEGRVRMLFPLDPGDDGFVRGARDYEIRGRGDRHAFTVYETSGEGAVYAAFSRDPFRFDEFVLGDHWDYGLAEWYVEEDAEAELTALVQRMVGNGRFDYDLVRYDVGRDIAYYGQGYRPSIYEPYYSGHYWNGYSAFSIHFGFGSFYSYRPHYWRVGYGYYDPYWYDPFFYGDAYGYHGHYAGYRPIYRAYPRTVVVTRPRTYGVRRYTFKSSADRWGIRPRTVEPRRRSYASGGGTTRRAVTSSRVRPTSPASIHGRRVSRTRSSATPADRTTPSRRAAPANGTQRDRRLVPTRRNSTRPSRGSTSRREAQPERRSTSANGVRRASPAARETPRGRDVSRPRPASDRRATRPGRSTRRNDAPGREARPRSTPRSRSARPAPPSRSAAPPRRSATPARARPSARPSAPRRSASPPRSAPRRTSPSRSSGRRRN